jgi:malate dehydrogenase (oxaloacetate-decarboxylating)
MSENHDYNAEALELHKQYGGKLETVSKLKLDNREALSRAYTPGVAAVCNAIAADKSLDKVLTLKKNTVAIVSDGSAILGLGNLGASAAIPVMEGKAAILKEFANVDAFPICIDTQDTEEIIKIIKNIAPVFGGINLEDIASPKCFEIEERLRAELSIPVMHDDQWGAATVALAAFINSIKLADKKKEDVRVVLSGVGAAGVATARLLNAYGVKNIVYVDSKGIINESRADLNKEKLELLNNSSVKNLSGDLTIAVSGADVFIGLSKPNVLTADMVKTMNSKSIIFGLANPTPEIMPELAHEAGAFIVATGRSDYANQINNSLVFPGFWRGVLDAQSAGTYKKIELETFVTIGETLASYVTDLRTDNILPNMFDKGVVKVIADIVSK